MRYSAFLLSLFLGGWAGAQTLPTAEEILSHYVQALGGEAAHAKIHSAVTVATVEFTGTGRSGTRTSYRAAPNKSYSVLEFQGIGKFEEGTNGVVAWSRSPLQGVRIKEGEERDVALHGAAFNGELRLKELYPKIEVAGVDSVAGKPCYKLILTPSSGPVLTRYFDRDTGLLVKSLMTVNTPAGEREVETLIAAYQETDGVKMPSKIYQRGGGQEMAITIESIRYNTGIPPDRFDLPDDVKKLLGTNKSR